LCPETKYLGYVLECQGNHEYWTYSYEWYCDKHRNEANCARCYAVLSGDTQYIVTKAMPEGHDVVFNVCPGCLELTDDDVKTIWDLETIPEDEEAEGDPEDEAIG
jgi:hypothetical protein